MLNWFQRNDNSGSGIASHQRSTLVKHQLTTEFVQDSHEENPILFSLHEKGLHLAPMADDTGSDLDSETSSGSQDEQDIDHIISDLWHQMVINIKSKAPNQGKAIAPSYLVIDDSERVSPDEVIFHNSNLPDVFCSVWFRKGSKEEWQTSFNCLLPRTLAVRHSNIQNYRQCRYFKTWMRILDANKDNGRVIDAIRDAFWGRIRQWSWLPNAQVDRIWLTTVRRPNNHGFK